MHDPELPLITLAEASGHWNGRVSAKCLWRWCRDGILCGDRPVRLRTVRVGGRHMTTVAWVVSFLEEIGDFDAETGVLAAVGLGNVPTWLRPYSVLSNSEKFRATLARLRQSRVFPGRGIVGGMSAPRLRNSHGFDLQGSGVEGPGDQGSLPKRIYFLSGFDPRGSSLYYRLFAEQLAAYATRSGRQLSVSRRRRQKDSLVSSWQVLEQPRTPAGSITPEALVRLEVCFLHWDDIARQNWPKSPLRLIADGVGCYRWYLFGGGMFRIGRLAPRVALCGLWPFLFFASCLALTLAVASALAQWVNLWLGLAVAAGLASAAWRLAKLRKVDWLFRSIRFTHRLGQARDGSLRSRLIELAARVVALEHEAPAARVQLVGHSSGSFVMAMLAAELRRQPGFEAALAPRVSLLSLGQNLGNLGVYKSASAFHDDLRTLAVVPRLPWRDITSRDDYLCFAGADPYRSCRIAIEPPAYPELQLIQLAQRLGLRRWGALITNQFPLHFEYLHTASPERQGGFDYFEELLGERS